MVCNLPHRDFQILELKVISEEQPCSQFPGRMKILPTNCRPTYVILLFA